MAQSEACDSGGTFCVATVNCRCLHVDPLSLGSRVWRRKHHAARLRAIMDKIWHRCDPDVVCMQEVGSAQAYGALVELCQAKRLSMCTCAVGREPAICVVAGRLCETAHADIRNCFSDRLGGTLQKLAGNVIVCKHAMSDARARAYRAKSYAHQHVLVASCGVAGGAERADVACTHLSLLRRQQTAQIRELGEWVRDDGGADILCGDFNVGQARLADLVPLRPPLRPPLVPAGRTTPGGATAQAGGAGGEKGRLPTVRMTRVVRFGVRLVNTFHALRERRTAGVCGADDSHRDSDGDGRRDDVGDGDARGDDDDDDDDARGDVDLCDLAVDHVLPCSQRWGGRVLALGHVDLISERLSDHDAVFVTFRLPRAR